MPNRLIGSEKVGQPISNSPSKTACPCEVSVISGKAKDMSSPDLEKTRVVACFLGFFPVRIQTILTRRRPMLALFLLIM